MMGNRTALVEAVVLALCIACGRAAHATTQADAAGTELTRIVDNLLSNESLYENLEVRLRTESQLGEPINRLPIYLARGDRSSRFVSQQGMLYVSHDGKDVAVSGEIQDGSYRAGFDGLTTRVVDQESVANIRDGRSPDLSGFRPHTIFLVESAGVDFPLSQFLRGDVFLRSLPRFRDMTTRITYVGDDEIQDLKCHKLRIEYLIDSWTDRSRPHVRFLWIAPDRNYLAVRTEFFQSPWNENDDPMEVGWVEDLREIAPGVWFPFRSVLRVFDVASYEHGRHVVANTIKKFVEMAKLDPQYDVGLFRNIEIPNGVDVYVFQGDKLVRKYTQGGAHTQPPQARSFPWMTVALTVAFGAFLAFHRHRRRARAA
ncbi:MAG: hypothetical protein KatS3mg108_0966 [Isosphaeraceae bacterium]|jgi:hypothetical protein|nr:MAG: hypothetical protein KatS3mg108_0966 [Isosphaeraceae bacterium]